MERWLVLCFCLSGKRVCLGEQLAKSELFIFFTSLVQKFTFRAPNDEKLSLKYRTGITISPVNHRLCAVPRSWCLKSSGRERRKESKKCGVFEGTGTYSEGRWWNGTWLNSRGSTIQIPALLFSLMEPWADLLCCEWYTFSSRRWKADNDSSSKGMDFEWFGNHTAYQKN